MVRSDNIKIFPGNIFVELDLHYIMRNGLRVFSKLYRKKHKGKVIIGGGKVSGDDHIFFLSQEGQMFEGKVLMHESDVILKFNQNKKTVEILGERILIEPHKEKSELSANLKASDAHRKIIPVGTILQVGDEVKKAKAGDEVIYTPGREIDLTPYNIDGFEKKTIFIVKEPDIVAIL